MFFFLREGQVGGGGQVCGGKGKEKVNDWSTSSTGEMWKGHKSHPK